MPIYEYRCLECKKDHEILKKFSDKPLKKCPSCGGRLEKKLSLSGFQLKGSGWYKDGYASPKPEKTAGKDTTAPSAEASPAVKAGSGAPKAPDKSSQTAPSPPASGGPPESPKKEKSGPKRGQASSG